MTSSIDSTSQFLASQVQSALERQSKKGKKEGHKLLSMPYASAFDKPDETCRKTAEIITKANVALGIQAECKPPAITILTKDGKVNKLSPKVSEFCDCVLIWGKR